MGTDTAVRSRVGQMTSPQDSMTNHWKPGNHSLGESLSVRSMPPKRPPQEPQLEALVGRGRRRIHD